MGRREERDRRRRRGGGGGMRRRRRRNVEKEGDKKGKAIEKQQEKWKGKQMANMIRKR